MTGDERSARAGEYVLGTLPADEREAFERELAGDRALRAEVYHWQDRLLALTRHAEAVAPRPPLWRRIEVSLDAATDRARPRPAQPAQPRAAPWWQRLSLWQGLSAASAAAAIAMAVLLVQPPGEPAAARYVALLQSPDTRDTGWVVELRADGVLRLRPVGAAPAVPPGRALEFWTKPEGAAGPTSLGLVQAGQVVELPLSRLPAVGERQLFEITLEPATGSPVGRPTGPILAVGSTVAL